MTEFDIRLLNSLMNSKNQKKLAFVLNEFFNIKSINDLNNYKFKRNLYLFYILTLIVIWFILIKFKNIIYFTNTKFIFKSNSVVNIKHNI